MKKRNMKEDRYFDKMETAFGVDHKHENMTDEEKAQFDEMEELDIEKVGDFSKAKHPADSKLTQNQKESGKDATSYYKSIIDKMAKNQKTNVENPDTTRIGESKDDNALTRLDEDNLGTAMSIGVGMAVAVAHAFSVAPEYIEMFEDQYNESREPQIGDTYEGKIIDVTEHGERYTNPYNGEEGGSPQQGFRVEVLTEDGSTIVFYEMTPYREDIPSDGTTVSITIIEHPNTEYISPEMWSGQQYDVDMKNEEFEPKKTNIEDDERDMYYGTGMEGLSHDDEDTDRYKEFEERNDELNDDKEGTTYNELKKAGKKYKKYKYGDKKGVEDEYHETPKVRVTNENKKGLSEEANTDLELKSVAKKVFSILKKFGLRPNYETGEINMEDGKDRQTTQLRIRENVLAIGINKYGLEKIVDDPNDYQKKVGEIYKAITDGLGSGFDFKSEVKGSHYLIWIKKGGDDVDKTIEDKQKKKGYRDPNSGDRKNKIQMTNKNESKMVYKDVIKEVANQDLELKSLAKKAFSILKKYGLRPEYKTDVKFDTKQKSEGYGGKVQMTTDKGGNILSVGAYYLGINSILKSQGDDTEKKDDGKGKAFRDQANGTNESVSRLSEMDMGEAPPHENDVYGGVLINKEQHGKIKAVWDRIVNDLNNIVTDEFETHVKEAKNKYGMYYMQIRKKKSGKIGSGQNESKMVYKDVIEENTFKAKGKLVSEEQVLKLANKVPSRVKIDETVFAITDGDNSYRLMWEGEEAIITHNRNEEMVSESIDEMKRLYNFNTKDSISTKKTITESGEDSFKRMFNQIRNGDGVIVEGLIKEGDASDKIKSWSKQIGGDTVLSPFVSNVKVNDTGDGSVIHFMSSTHDGEIAFSYDTKSGKFHNLHIDDKNLKNLLTKMSSEVFGKEASF